MSDVDNTLEDLDVDTLGLLDRELDDIEDLPGFECPSDGHYVLSMKTAIKTVNQRPAVEFSYEVMECMKKNDESDPDSPAGTKFSQLCFLKAKPGGDPESIKFSIDQMKKLTKPVAEKIGVGNLLELVRDHISKGCVISAAVSGKKDKENPEIRRPRLSNIEYQGGL